MKVTIKNFISLLDKVSYTQLILLGFISIVYFLCKEYSVFTGILLSGIASFTYTQLIKLSNYSKIFALFGFPIRLILVAVPCAILVNKLHSNLLALFVGFALSQLIYFLFVWSYANHGVLKNNKCHPH